MPHTIDAEDHRWLIAIGLCEYQDKNFTPLKYCCQDVDSLVEYFQHDGLPKEQMLILKNDQATTENIRKAISDFGKKIPATGRLFFFISGHGAPDPSPNKPNVHYFITYNTRQEMPETALPMQEVKDAIANLKISEALLMLDTCHSGSTKAGGFKKENDDALEYSLKDLSLVRTRPVLKIGVLSSSRAYEKSQEKDEWKAGVFTHCMMLGLRGSADDNQDGIISIHELSYYVQSQVGKVTEHIQNPTCNFSGNWNPKSPFGKVATNDPFVEVVGDGEAMIESGAVALTEPSPVATIEPNHPASSPVFSLELATERGNNEAVYYHGDLLKLKVKTSKPCYLQLYYLQSNGEIIQIFPNGFYKKNLILANRTYTIPEPHWPFEFEIDCSEYFGSETIHAFASLKPLEELPGEPLEGGIGRSIKLKAKQISEECRKNQDTVEASCTIITKKK